MTRAEFLAHVQKYADLSSTKEAERWSLAVLVSLMHLLDEAELRRQFVAQLPGFFKSRLQEEPPRGLVMDREAFLQHVAAALDTHVAGAERAVRSVYGAVKAAVSRGQITKLEAHLPEDLVTFLKGGHERTSA
jgi:uncharacterized protein (DUF2267 family)